MYLLYTTGCEAFKVSEIASAATIVSGLVVLFGPEILSRLYVHSSISTPSFTWSGLPNCFNTSSLVRKPCITCWCVYTCLVQLQKSNKQRTIKHPGNSLSM